MFILHYLTIQYNTNKLNETILPNVFCGSRIISYAQFSEPDVPDGLLQCMNPSGTSAYNFLALSINFMS